MKDFSACRSGSHEAEPQLHAAIIQATKSAACCDHLSAASCCDTEAKAVCCGTDATNAQTGTGRTGTAQNGPGLPTTCGCQ